MTTTSYIKSFLPVILFTALLAGCGGGGGGGTSPLPSISPGPLDPALAGVNDFTYWLDNIDLAAIGNSAFDLVIIDYSSDGTAAHEFSTAQIAALKSSPGGNKTVLAYLSIGEAENYRYYWQSSWNTSPPAWLGPVNPDWPGNYRVRYWDAGWQAIVLDYLDKIIAAGFDGVYLDIVDGFEYWGPEGSGARPTAEQDMVDWVTIIANHARVTRGLPGFIVIPQNGEALAAHPEYLAVVSGIGREDTWYDGNTAQPTGETNWVLGFLDQFRAAGKIVLVTDYITTTAKINDFYSKAQTRYYVPYATIRDLDRLTINPGHEPD